MRLPIRVLVLLALLAATGCGEEKVAGAQPEPVATAFAKAWTEGRCAKAMEHAATLDKSLLDGCERTFHFGTKCDEVQPGDPRPVDCGKGTTIAVRKAEVTSSKATGETAQVAVLVSYTQGKTTRESRTLKVQLRETDGVWKVTGTG